MKKFFEELICGSRWFILVAVVCSMVSAIVMLGVGALDVGYDIWIIIGKFSTLAQTDTIDKDLVLKIISAVDAFLIATVLFIFSIGLYELFISKINTDKFSSKILVVKTLDQLKEKLAKVILMVLIVTYFKFALGFEYRNPLDLLYLSVGIFLVSLSVYLNHGKQQHHPRHREKPKL